MGDVQRLLQRRRDAGEGGPDLGGRDPQLVEVDAVVAGRAGTKRCVAAGAHLGDDGRHRVGGPVLLVDRSRQERGQLAAVAGEAAEVESTEGHGSSMLSERRRCPSWPRRLVTHVRAVARCPRWRRSEPHRWCHDRPMSASSAELSSLATALDELTRRVTVHAEAADGAKDEETARRALRHRALPHQRQPPAGAAGTQPRPPLRRPGLPIPGQADGAVRRVGTDRNRSDRIDPTTHAGRPTGARTRRRHPEGCLRASRSGGGSRSLLKGTSWRELVREQAHHRSPEDASHAGVQFGIFFRQAQFSAVVGHRSMGFTR